MVSGRTGDDISGLHVQVRQELRQRDDMIGIARDRDPFLVEVLVHVAHGIEQAAAFFADGGGHVHAAIIAQGMNEPVGFCHPDGQFEERAPHAAFLSSSVAAGCEVKCPRAMVEVLSPVELRSSIVAPPCGNIR